MGRLGTRRSKGDDETRPDSNLSKISIGGNTGGLIVTLGLIAIGLAGLPPARWFLAASVLLGLIVALILRLTARDR
jgi:hypothetical protein